MNTDPIADFLTRIRNASMNSHPWTDIPASALKVELTKLLLREGYIRGYEMREDKETGFKVIRILLKYDPQGYPVIRKIRRVSRPGLRKYFRVNSVPRVMNGSGVAVLSTNKGLKTDREARRERVGGELLCTVY